MSDFRSITDLAVAESTEGLNLIGNIDGVAHQVPVDKIGAQADWNETDENSPAYVKNKPETGSVTIFTYLSDDNSFYLKDNPDEDFIFPRAAAAPNPLNATKITYDMLNEAMKKGGVLCDMSGYEISSPSALGSDSSSGGLSVYAPVISYAKMSYGTSDSSVMTMDPEVTGDAYMWGLWVCLCGEILTFTYEVYPESDK